jgi:hypothetical protein
MKYSPVLITVYDRYDHLVKCVNSLKDCTGASNTTLYVALDYPVKKEGEVIYNKILDFVEGISGFQKVICFNRVQNYGAVKNIFVAIEDVFSKHQTVIISEDDNIFSKNFLEYINKGLNLFENDSSIFSISGYNYPLNNESFDNVDSYYKWTGFSAWGCGLWKEKYEKVDVSINYVNEFLHKKGNINLLYKYADHYFPGAVDMLYHRNIAGDTIFSIYQAENNMHSIFPGLSKVRNLGHDGSGVHNSHTNYELFANQIIDTRRSFDFKNSNNVTSAKINLLMKGNFERSWKSRVYHWVRLKIKLHLR